jgi:hypothetical protein
MSWSVPNDAQTNAEEHENSSILNNTDGSIKAKVGYGVQKA